MTHDGDGAGGRGGGGRWGRADGEAAGGRPSPGLCRGPAGRAGAGLRGPAASPLETPRPGRTHSLSHSGGPLAVNMALDSAPDVFVMQVLLEETGEMFTVTNCHGDMTVQRLKEELDLVAGIPLNLQLLQYLDQGGPFSPLPSPCILPGPR